MIDMKVFPRFAAFGLHQRCSKLMPDRNSFALLKSALEYLQLDDDDGDGSSSI